MSILFFPSIPLSKSGNNYYLTPSSELQSAAVSVFTKKLL